MNKMKPLKTVAGHHFLGAGTASKNIYLCQVNEGVNVCDALLEASKLVSMAQAHSFEVGMGNGGELPDNFAWLAYHALETAEAIIHSVVSALADAQQEE